MKTIIFWILAIIITLSAAIYQRRTGPTKDKRIKLTIENTEYNIKLKRSHGGKNNCIIKLQFSDKSIGGKLLFKPFPTNHDWTIVEMSREDDFLVGTLPHLPPAGKYEYKIVLNKNNIAYPLNEGIPVIIRFKGDVPAYILIPHIILMFFAMLLGNLAGIMAIFKHKQFKLYTNLTIITLFTGGLVFGPWVQWHAFGEAWAGVPFAWDLTDNKTLVSFLFWILAYIMNRKREQPTYTILAAIVMLLIYIIPHSMYGSQLDPKTGEIIQGWIQLVRV